jgi:hypothetical protein
MKALLVLVVAPVLIGIAAELVFRDARKASLAATLGSALAVALSVQLLDSTARWSWVAAVLVSPVPIALAVATALLIYGHWQGGRHGRWHDR